MNPYVKAKRERYDELRQAIETVRETAQREDRDLTEPEMRQVQEYGGECRTLWCEIEELAEEEHRSERVQELAGTLMAPPPAEDELRSQVPPLMPSRQQLEVMFRTVAEGRPAEKHETAATQLRAAVTLGGDVGAVSSPLSERPLVDPRRLAVAAGLLVERVDGITGAAFPVFGAGSAGVTAEGVAKTEYSAIDPGTAVPVVINAYTDFTRQAATTHLSFEARLRQKLAALVAVKEDSQLVAKVLGTTGLPVLTGATGTPFAQQVLIAAGTVAASVVGQDPDLVVLNPADLGKVMGAGVGNTPPGELAELNLRLYGMRVYPSTSVAAGTALLGAWRASTRMVIGMNPTWLVDPYTGLKTNVITGLLEEAVDLAVEEPQGFVKLTLTT